MEAEIATLREEVNRNSGNSSQPPSSDGPQSSKKPGRQAKSGRQRGGQKGHPGARRELVPVEEVKEVSQVVDRVVFGHDPDNVRTVSGMRKWRAYGCQAGNG